MVAVSLKKVPLVLWAALELMVPLVKLVVMEFFQAEDGIRDVLA